MPIDTASLLAATDLAALIGADVPLRPAAATNGGELAGPCPRCGGRDRFRVWPTPLTGRPGCWCRRCGLKGDAIGYLMATRGLSFVEACGQLGGGRQSVPRRPSMTVHCRPSASMLRPWTAAAAQLVAEAEAALWAPAGAPGRRYLAQRGLNLRTARRYRLGYLAAPWRQPPEAFGLPPEGQPLYLPGPAILLPWLVGGQPVVLKVRALTPAPGRPKYVQVRRPPGSAQHLYGEDGLSGDRPAIVVEGEFDALAIARHAGERVEVVATGSTAGNRTGRALLALAAAPAVYLAFDADGPGDEAAARWQSWLPHAIRLRPTAHDPAAMGAAIVSWLGPNGPPGSP